MSSFLRKNVCVFSLFRAVKKELVVRRIYQLILFGFFLLFLFRFFFFNSQEKTFFSVVYCLERSQSQCISVEPVSVMYVCLTTLGNLSLDGI